MSGALWAVAARSIYRAGPRTLLYVLVGVVLGVGLQVPLWASNVRLHETERYEDITSHGPVLRARGVVQGYRDRNVILIQVPPGATPPGMARPVGAGEAWLSPALARLTTQEALLSSWFHRYDLRTLSASATSSAGELKAYLADSGGVGPSFVDSQPSLAADTRPIGPYQMVGFILFAAIPAIALLLVATRFGHQQRMRRYLALRRIGVDRLKCHLLLGLEFAIPVTCGSLVSLAAPQVLSRDTLSIPITGRALYVDDLRLSLTQTIAVLAASLVIALFGGSNARWTASSSGSRQTISRLALIPFALGLLVGGLTWVNARPNDPLRTMSILLLVVGLPATSEMAARHLSRLVRRLANSPLSLVAARRTAADARGAARIASLVAVAIFAVGIAGPVVEVSTDGSQKWTDAAKRTGTSTMLVRGSPLDGSRLPAGSVPRGALPAAGLWQQGGSPPSRPPASAALGTCTQLRAVLGYDSISCDQQSGPLTWSAPPAPGLWSLFLGGDRTPLSVAWPADRVALSEIDSLSFEPDILLPPSALPKDADPYITEVYARLPTNEAAFETFRAKVISAAPGFRVESALTANYTPDSTTTWIVLGIVAVIAIATLAALLSAINDRLNRDTYRSLTVAGFSRRMLLEMRLRATAICAVAATFLSIGAVALILSAYGRVNGEDLINPTVLLGLTAVGIAAPVMLDLLFDVVTRRTGSGRRRARVAAASPDILDGLGT